MNDTFKPGDLCIYVRPGSPYYGTEVTVGTYIINGLVGGDHLGQMSLADDADGYEIRGLEHASITAAKAEWLRKKKPPSREIDQVTSWDKCAWKPRELVDA